MQNDNPVWYRRSVWVLVFLAGAIRLFYMLYTHRIWEDALITVQHSVDFVRGMGLTHPQPPGEGPLHGFTSPLSVLIPLVGDLMHPEFGVTFLRIVSIFAGAVCVWIAARLARAIGLPPALALTAAAFVAFEHHQILWGMAGMETQVVTLCYLLALYSVLFGSQWLKGIALGLCMLARPDACFLVAIICLIEIYRANGDKQWSKLVPVAGGLTLLYAPWLIFTTLYYGSPIPNTIRAKINYGTLAEQMKPLSLHGKVSLLIDRFYSVFYPTGLSYAGNGAFATFSHHYLFNRVFVVLLLIGLAYALKHRNSTALVLFSFVVVYALYLSIGVFYIFGWYTVPVAAVGVICMLYGVWSLIRFLPTASRSSASMAFGAVYILIIVGMLPWTFRSDKHIQADIETGVRMKMGQFLAQHTLPSDTISSESLGYVGYYSGRVVYDYPGLCSRDVVQYFHDQPDARVPNEINSRTMLRMFHHFEATYLVLRPHEIYFAMEKPWQDTWIGQDYDLVKVFKADEVDLKKNVLRPDVNIDHVFYVFRRKDAVSRDALPSS